MDSQELNKACELAFRVAREGVEQDPPIDPPPSMRMFLYVRQFPQRAITVARQALTEDAEFRARVAAEATEESVGAAALAWLNDANADSPSDPATAEGDSDANFSGSEDAVDEGPVTSESIRSEMDELKNLVGQLSEEGAAVGSEVEGLADRLEESEESAGLASALTDAAAAPAVSATSSLSGQVRSLHADLKQARSERDQAQEAKELAILEHAELAEELENLRTLAGSARVQLTDLEAKVDAVSSEKAQLETEKQELAAEREALTTDKDSLSAEVAEAAEKLAASEEKLASAEANLESLTAELETAKGSAGVSVDELQAAVAARAAMESHVDALGGAHAKAKAEMERVNAALGDKDASDSQKIETLKVALASVTAERDALQAKLEAVRATVTSLQGEMAKLDSNMTDAESVASVLNERMEELQTSVEGMPSDSVIAGDLAQFETPEKPEIAAFVAPAAFAAAATETEDIDQVADDVAEVVSSFEDDDTAEQSPVDGDTLPDEPEADEVQDSSHDHDCADEHESPETETSLDDSEHESLQDEGAAIDDQADQAEEVTEPIDVADELHADTDAAPAMLEEDFDWMTADADESTEAVAQVDQSIDAEVDSAMDIAEPNVDEEALSSWASETTDGELVPDEMIEPIDANDFIHNLEEVEAEEASVSPLVMSDTTDEVDVADAVAVDESSIEIEEIVEADAPETEDIDEVHALVAETVASFEPDETDDLPGSTVPAEEVQAAAPRKRGGLTSLFSSRRNEAAPAPEAEVAASDDQPEVAAAETDDDDGGLGKGLLAAAGVGALGAAAQMMGTGEVASEQIVDSSDVEPAPAANSRGPIQVPGDIATDPLATARHIVNTENAVVLVDGDPVAAMGWPSVERVEQRRNLVHYLSVMAGSSGAAPDVLLDRDFGADRLPDSRSVRVRVTNEEGSVSAQIVSLIDTYPHDWPVVVVTDNMDLAAEAAMKGATLLDNGQLLDLFIAP